MATTKTSRFFVYSMLANSQIYQLHGKAPASGIPPPVEGEVLVRGGAGMADKNFATPEGAIETPLTGEEAGMLEKNHTFLLHKKNGFVLISDEQMSGAVAASKMSGREPGGPTVPSDFEVKGADVKKEVVKLPEQVAA